MDYFGGSGKHRMSATAILMLCQRTDFSLWGLPNLEGETTAVAHRLRADRDPPFLQLISNA
jgi:hypothetical protein